MTDAPDPERDVRTADVATDAAAPSPPEVRRAPGSPRATRGERRKPIPPTPIVRTVGPLIWLGCLVIRCIARLFTRVEIVGEVAAFPRGGAVIVVANHASNADPALIGGFLNPRFGRPLNWMGKREVFESPVIAWLVRRAGVHPVDRGAADVEAFRTAMRILEGGYVLAVFPEGTRSPDGRLQPAKDGVAVLAARSGATIVPIGVADSDQLWPKGRTFPRRTPRVTVRVGAPFTLAAIMPAAPAPTAGEERAAGHSRRQSNAVATDLIMRRIAALLPPRQRGAYGGDGPG